MDNDTTHEHNTRSKGPVVPVLNTSVPNPTKKKQVFQVNKTLPKNIK